MSVPKIGDQPFWAARLAALGAAPPPVLYKRLSAAALTAPGQVPEFPGLRSPAISASIMSRTGLVFRASDRRHLDQGILEQLLRSGIVPGPLLGQVGTQPGVSPQHADPGGRDKRGKQHAPLGALARQALPRWSAFGLPGMFRPPGH